MTHKEADEDAAPSLAPVSAGRHGTRSLLVKLPTIRDEADEIAGCLKEASQKGMAWENMAVLYWDNKDKDEIFRVLKAQYIYVVGGNSITFDKDDTKVKFLTIRNSKWLEFQLVAIMGGRIVEQAKSDMEIAKLLYVAMTRATLQLVMTVASTIDNLTESDAE